MSRIRGIKEEEQEFMRIAKGLIRKDLARYLLRARFISRHGKTLIAIPITEIDLPTLRYGYPDEFIIGQGEGKPGDDLGPVEPDEDGGEQGGSGESDREKIIIEIDEEEFFEWFQELLRLPRLKPKGERAIFEERLKYNTIHRIGPLSAIHRQRTFAEAFKRSVATGQYHPPEKTRLMVLPPDMRFKDWQKIREPINNAVIAFMRDISGSMGKEEAEALSILCDYCERWIRANPDYKRGAIETFYVVHDGVAQEVSRRQFLASESWGGTVASSAHRLFLKIIGERFPPAAWNIYCFYFSDGFNYTIDNNPYLELMRESVLPIINRYNYGQTDLDRGWLHWYSESGSDTFSMPGTIGELLRKNFSNRDDLATAAIKGKDKGSLIEAIKEFFREKDYGN